MSEKAIFRQLHPDDGHNPLVKRLVESTRDAQGYSDVLGLIQLIHQELVEPPQPTDHVWLAGVPTLLQANYQHIDAIIPTPAREPTYRVRTQGGMQTLRQARNYLLHAQQARQPIGMAGTVRAVTEDVIAVEPRAIWYDSEAIARIVIAGVTRAYPIKN